MLVYDKQGSQHDLVSSEVGSNSNGNYIKFSNGIAICWGTISKNIVVNNKANGGAGAGLCYSQGYIIPLPIAFLNTEYHISVSLKKGPYVISVDHSRPNTTIDVSFGVIANTTFESMSFDFNFFVIGKWK